MEPVPHWRQPLTMGSVKDVAAGKRPIFLPIELHNEWDLVVQAHHNCLLLGTPTATREMFVALKPALREPLHEYMPPVGGPVPQPTEGTLALLEVARLDAIQQTQLLQWLDHFTERLPVQVVSTTSEPLFPRVQAGTFLADLYYKLNVVLIDLLGTGRRTNV